MGGAMKPRKKSFTGDGDRFLRLPHSVIQSNAYQGLSFSAKALLVEIGAQYAGGNNGRLIASRSLLKERGFSSSATLTKAIHELLEAGLIFQTVKGYRPNKASWFAITWQDLNHHVGFDSGARAGFRRSEYKFVQIKNAGLTSKSEAERPITAPKNELEGVSVAPENGAVMGCFTPAPASNSEHHLIAIPIGLNAVEAVSSSALVGQYEAKPNSTDFTFKGRKHECTLS